MRRLAVLLVVACGSSRPQVRNVEDDTPAPSPAPASAPVREPASPPRPAIDLSSVVPDPSERARWPLPPTMHPLFEPHFAVGNALAEPGVSWLDLCGRGIQHRHLPGNQAPVEYLRAWCAAEQHDAVTAVVALAQLRTTTVRGIRDALWFDIANILAEHGDADAAERIIDKSFLDHEVELLDILAATYAELGKLGDAAEIDRLATEADHGPGMEASCHRSARRIVSADPSEREQLVDRFHRSLPSPGNHRGTCEEIDHELECWAFMQCYDYLRDTGGDERYADLITAYRRWPISTSSAQWLGTAVTTVNAIGVPGADGMALTALEMALRTSHCLKSSMDTVAALILEARDKPATAFDPRLDALRATIERVGKLPTAECERELAAMQSP